MRRHHSPSATPTTCPTSRRARDEDAVLVDPVPGSVDPAAHAASSSRNTPTLIPMSVNVTIGPVLRERARRAARGRDAARPPCPPAARVVRAADADRPERHAVRADPAAALGARDVRLPVGMPVAAKRLGHGGLAYPRARRRRVHSGRGRSGPDRDRHRRHPRDVDDLPGARRRATSGCSAPPRSRRRARCATRSARASSAASGTPCASPASTSATRRASTSSRSPRR